MADTLSYMHTPNTKGFKAEAIITRYRAVKLGTNDGEVIMTTDSDTPIGVALETVALGQNVRVALPGCIAPVQVNAGVTKGAAVAAAAADGLVDDNGSAGEVALGFALLAATAQNDIIPVLISLTRIHS